MRRVLLWFFRNRETGAITVAQPPNLALWIAIVAAFILWVLHPTGRVGAALELIFKGALLFWAIDEVVRGVNPWRRCLGGAVICYGLITLLL